MPEWVDGRVVSGGDTRGGWGWCGEQGCNWDLKVSTYED